MAEVAGKSGGGEKSGFGSGLVVSRPETPQGCLWRHAKTKGIYWQVSARWAPVELRTGRKFLTIAMVFGQSKFATKSMNHAKAVRRRMWTAWGRRTQMTTGRRTIDQWIERFRVWNTNKGTSRRQVDFNAGTAAKFAAFAEVTQPVDILAEHLDDYLADLRTAKGRTRRTVQAHAVAVGMFCRFLIRRGELDVNPVDGIDLAAPDRRPPRFLTGRQIRALLERARLKVIDGKDVPAWVHDAIAVGVFEGPRMAQIRALRWQDVFGDYILFGGAVATKTGDYRTVPIFPEMRPILKAMRRRGKRTEVSASGFIFPQHNPRWWLEHFQRITAGLAPFGNRAQWKLLRSTFACQRAGGVGLERPASPWELAAWLGHASVATTMRYVNLARAAGLARLKG